MNLGETIYRLRTEKNMSQGDLADALGVSRQSVSKWETGNATPDLDKLVRLSKLFGVTLDELVNGSIQEEAPSTPQVIVQSREPLSVQKITGIVLLCFGLAMFLMMFWSSGFTALISCLIYSAPLLLCGIICLKAGKNTLLLCILMLYFWLWLPMGILAPNYILGDYAKVLQALHMLWGGGLIYWSWQLRKRGVFCTEQRNAIVCFGALAASILLSYLFMRFPGLLPTPGLHYS